MRSLRSQNGWCRRAQRLLLGVLAIGLVAFYLGAYRPQMLALNDLRQQADRRRGELHTAEARARTLPAVMHEVEQLRQRLARFDKKLPRQQDMDQFLRDIAQLGQQAGLRKWTFQTDVPRRRELFVELPIRVTFEGDFDSVYAFLRQAEQMQRLTRIARVHLNGVDPQSGQVSVDAQMQIYFTQG
jgi:Tfp pilus assembly protein PilO